MKSEQVGHISNRAVITGRSCSSQTYWAYWTKK